MVAVIKKIIFSKKLLLLGILLFAGCSKASNNISDLDGIEKATDTVDVDTWPEITGFVSADENLLNNNAQSKAGSSNNAYSTSIGSDSIDTSDNFDWAQEDAGTDYSPGATEVTEGDIYRVLSDNIILNLNSYRGLQIIDFEDPQNPRIIGRYATRGTPVEMYASNNQVFILFNNWQGYYGNRNNIDVENYSGGLVVAVDISDLENPKVICQKVIKGSILTSRMTEGPNSRALYVAANEDYSTAVVQSFSISSQGQLTKKTVLNLGGYLQNITATPKALLVSRENNTNSTVSLIDITSPLGEMVESAEIITEGVVLKKTDMSIHNNILRIVSGNSWRNIHNTNFIETWNIEDFNNPIAVDSATFGDEENLYATLFLENKAFFVTFLEVDPFYSFEIDDEGYLTQKTEYKITGWNDYFKPAFNNSRIMGIGRNNGTLAISMYTTDLDETSPFVTRVQITEGWANSEATWDDRAFTVIDDAVSILNDQGQEETGLILLPFGSYWNSDSGVKVLTYSPDSLTLRGTLKHSTEVRRSFLADSDMIASMSEDVLNLYNFEDPNEPSFLGSVELSPHYSDFLVYADFGVRVKTQPEQYYDYWDYNDLEPGWEDFGTNRIEDTAPPDSDWTTDTAWNTDTEWSTDSDTGDTERINNDTVGQQTEEEINTYVQENTKTWDIGIQTNQTGMLEIISMNDSPETPNIVSRIEIPQQARVHKKDNLAIVISPTGVKSGNWTIDVIDLSNPAQPKKAGTLSTALFGYYHNSNNRMYYNNCYGSRCYENIQASNAQIAGDVLVISSLKPQKKVLGTTRICETFPEYYSTYETSPGISIPVDTDPSISWDQTEQWQYVYYQGFITCSSKLDETECKGKIEKCTESSINSITCEEVDPAEIKTIEYCSTHEEARHWNSWSFTMVDLSSPQNPVLLPGISLNENQEAAGMVVKDSKMYVNHKEPITIEGDSRAYVRYYVTIIDLDNPKDIKVSDPINIPGAVFAVNNNKMVTRDPVWTDERIDTTLNTISINNKMVEVLGSKKFEDKKVNTIIIDDSNHAFVTLSAENKSSNDYEDYYYIDVDFYYYDYSYNLYTAQSDELKVIDINSSDMAVLGTLEVDSWSTLQRVQSGKALFSVPGGLLIANVEDVTAPFAQAYYPLQGWNFNYVLANDKVLLTTGKYGIIEFDLNDFHLLED